MKHCIEITVAPYSLAQPRRYYAADYPAGSCIDDAGVTYQVREMSGVLMFVAVLPAVNQAERAGSLNVQPIHITQRILDCLKLAQNPHLNLEGYERVMRVIRTLRTAPRYQYNKRQAS